jgi:hypothetical protein
MQIVENIHEQLIIHWAVSLDRTIVMKSLVISIQYLPTVDGTQS